MVNKKSSYRSLFPREEYLFVATRLLAILGIISWLVFNPSAQEFNTYGVWMSLLAFAIYLGLFTLFAKNTSIPLPVLYRISLAFDIIFISTLIYCTGGVESNFFLLYYLVIGFSAYFLGIKGGILIALLSTIAYLLISSSQITKYHLPDLGVRLSLAWFYALAIGVFSKHLRKSSKKLLKLLDILNERTTELERTQIQLETIYETSRSLGEIHNLDEVFVEINNIADNILGYPLCGIVVLNKNREYLELTAMVENGAKKLFRDPRKLDFATLPGEVINTGKVQRINNLFESQKSFSLMKGVLSQMAVPMRARGQIVGVLIAESTKAEAFNERDEKLFTILAASAGMAIDNARMHKHISNLTMIDDLTGIFNYRYFVQKLEDEKRRAARYNIPLSLVMLDLDWFKKTNDSFGHEVGNIVLKELVKVVKQCVRDTDTLCRYGGEEFIVILPLTGSREAKVLAERIRLEVEKFDFGIATGIPNLRITVSLGTTSFPDNGLSTMELVQTVDTALYRAKGSGKNMVCTV